MTAEQFEMIRLNNMEQHGFGPDVMKRIKICALCGKSAEVSDTICEVCGEPLPQESVFQQYKKRHLYCPRCETVVPSHTQFCPQCGLGLRVVSRLAPRME